MFGIKTFTAGLLLGVGGAMFISHYHVVHTNLGVVVVPRTQRPPLRSSYVDIRTWGEAMWVNHPEVTQALISDGRSALIGENLKDNLLEGQLPGLTAVPTAARSGTPIDAVTQRVGQPGEIIPAPRKRLRTGSVPNTFQTQTYADQAGQMLDQALAPIVDDELETPVVSPPATSPDSGISVYHEPPKYTLPTDHSSDTLENRSRELIRQMIPPMSTSPNSATPLRDLSRDWLSAPAPGSNAPAPLDGALNESRIDGIQVQ